MTRPQELVEAILYSLKQSKELPDKTSYVSYTPDITTEAIKLPVVEVSLGGYSEVGRKNSDFVEYQTTSGGQHVGRIYQSLYSQIITVAVWTAQGSRYDPQGLSSTVRTVLYKHRTAGPEVALTHPDIGSLDDVWRFDGPSGEKTDDLTTSPPLRRWEQQIIVNSSEQYIETADEATISTANEDVEVLE